MSIKFFPQDEVGSLIRGFLKESLVLEILYESLEEEASQEEAFINGL